MGEINAHVGLYKVIDGGDNAITTLVTAAKMTPAYIRDWQSADGDMNSLWVRTQASSGGYCSYTGSPTITTENGKTVYQYSGTTAGKMRFVSDVEDTTKTGAVTIKYTVSTATPITATLYYKEGSTYKVYPGSLYTGYHKSTLVLSNATDTGSGSATITITPLGADWSSGKITHTPKTAEVVERKALEQAVLTPAVTGTERWSWYKADEGAATKTTKTFLVA